MATESNITSKPNNRPHSVAQTTRAGSRTTPSSYKLMQQDYWTAFGNVLRKRGGPVSGYQKPQPSNYMSYPIGRTGFKIDTVMKVRKQRIQAELYIKGKDAKSFFHLLHKQKNEIENELGCSLGWEELPNGKDSRIAIYCDNVDARYREDWESQHEWLAEKANELHRVFSKRIRALKPEDWIGN